MDYLKPADPNRIATASKPAVSLSGQPERLPVRLTYLLETPAHVDGEVLRVTLAE